MRMENTLVDPPLRCINPSNLPVLTLTEPAAHCHCFYKYHRINFLLQKLTGHSLPDLRKNIPELANFG
jgi:hypothetical protein